MCRSKIFGWCLVTVLSIASFVRAQDSNPIDPKRGAAPGASYSISDIENINLTNGNLMLNIPVASTAPARNGIVAQISLQYNTKLYEPRVEELPDLSNQLKDQNVLIPS